MAKNVYLILLISCMSISFFSMLDSGYLSGELSHFKIDITKQELFFLFFVHILLYFFVWLFYKVLTFRNFRLSKCFFKVNRFRLSLILLLVLVSQLIFVLMTGVGVVFSDASSPLSPIFNILNPTAFIPIYYIFLRNSKGVNFKIFIVNMIVFSMYKLAQGWTGFILVLFVLEINNYFSKHDVKKIRRYVFSLLGPFLILFLGALIYKPLYVFKNEIRGSDVGSITYVESLEHLASRLTFFPISVGAYQRSEMVVENFKYNSPPNKEIIAVFKPFLPRFIMPNKEFRSLDNNVMQAFYPDYGGEASANFGFLMYSYIIFKADPTQFLFYIFFVVFSLIIVKFFYDTLGDYVGQLNILLFFYVLNLFEIASLEIVFGYGFLSMIYFFFVLTCLGCFKIARVQGN